MPAVIFIRGVRRGEKVAIPDGCQSSRVQSAVDRLRSAGLAESLTQLSKTSEKGTD